MKEIDLFICACKSAGNDGVIFSRSPLEGLPTLPRTLTSAFFLGKMKKGNPIIMGEEAEWDKAFSGVLARSHPKLFATVCQQVENGQSPETIERFCRQYAPTNSNIPNLVRCAAEHHRRVTSN